MNLAFVTNVSGTTTTYQTRSGAAGGQLWLAAGQDGVKEVTLAEADFAQQWALATVPDVGVGRPASDDLQKVSELQVRVYLSNAVVPTQGYLFVDALRIR